MIGIGLRARGPRRRVCLYHPRLLSDAYANFLSSGANRDHRNSRTEESRASAGETSCRSRQSRNAARPARAPRRAYAAELLGLRLDVPWSVWHGYEAGGREPGILWRYDAEERTFTVRFENELDLDDLEDVSWKEVAARHCAHGGERRRARDFASAGRAAARARPTRRSTARWRVAHARRSLDKPARHGAVRGGRGRERLRR